MSDKNALMWFETAKPVKTRQGIVIIPEGIKVEMAVFKRDNDGKKWERPYAENIAVFDHNSSPEHEYRPFGSFRQVRRFLVLPKRCMLSGVGDIFCSTTKNVFAVTHFGESGFWGYSKRILPNQSHFEYCPECGQKLSFFPVIRQRDAVLSLASPWIGWISKDDE